MMATPVSAEGTSLWPTLAAVAHSIRFIDAGGIRTRILEAGDGSEAVIFLHGSAGHLEAYTRNIEAHARHFRTISVDMLGHGFTDKPDRDYDIADYCSHLIDVMDALGIARTHLSGESLGGWVAAAFAARHPERVGRLILNTPGGLTADLAVMERQKELGYKAVDEPNRDNVRTRLEWLMADPTVVTPDLVDMRYRIYSQPGFAQTMRHILSLQDMGPRLRNMLDNDDLRAIAAPTLVIWTDHDPTGAVEVGERFAEFIPDARLIVMEHCGHWPQFEDPATFNQVHIDFLRGAA
jgi:2-hydroxy-6-oxonona-2,4-dienedioate hydrolase